MSLKPVVFDCNHNNDIGKGIGGELAGFTALKNAGFVAGILKARQGINFGDPAYARRRHLMRSVGLRVGAYDFATHDDPVENAKDFLAYILPDPDGVFPFLDLEDNKASNMTGEQALVFLDYVSQKFGFPCGLYGGNRIIEQLSPLAHSSSKTADTLRLYPLWLCSYKVQPALRNADLETLKPHIVVPYPWTWEEMLILQYAADGVGPQPHIAPGLENGADLNVYDGTPEALAARWDAAIKPPAPVVASPAPPAAAVTAAISTIKQDNPPVPATWAEIEAAIIAALHRL